MAKSYNPVLQKRLEELIESLGGKEGGQTRAAQVIGYSTGTLSTYRNSKYNGDVTKLESRLQELFENQEEAAALHTAIDYVPTSISQQVYETIRICHLKGSFTVECGDAGIGKTKAAKKYLADYPNSTIYISINPCFATVTSFFRYLCRELRLPIGTKDTMWLNIFDHLRGGKKVLIVDEAQHLPVTVIDALRDFFDKNEELGIILIGNPTTVTKRGGVQKQAYDQIDNRTRWTGIRRTTHITRNDIQLLFPSMAGQAKEIDLLHVIAQTRAGVRGAVYLYSNAADNKDTSYDGLLAMAKAMNMMIL